MFVYIYNNIFTDDYLMPVLLFLVILNFGFNEVLKPKPSNFNFLDKKPRNGEYRILQYQQISMPTTCTW